MLKLVSTFGIAGVLQLGIAQPAAPPAAPPARVPPTSVPRTPGTPTPAPSPEVPRTPGNPVPAPSPEVPRSRGILPPGPGVNPTGAPPTRGLSNAVPTTILPSGTNPTILTPLATNLPATNRLANATNDVRSGNFAITNSLASMSPAQARNVIQVQNALNNLQTAAANLAGVQNLQQVIQQDPQMQQQLQQISTQINALAQGPVKPSAEIVHRLTADLVPVFSRARLSPDGQLALAVIINQACNSGRLSSEQVNDLLNHAQVTLQGSGVPASVAHPVQCDLHSIIYELQPNPGS